MGKKTQLKIEYLKKEDLKTYANNAKVHTPEQIEEIKHSIDKFGFNDPIAIWKDEVVEGHGRLQAVMEMQNISEVPVVRLDHLSDVERKAYMIVHNKLTMNTSFDNDILSLELKEITPEIDMSDLGFSNFEIDMLTEDFSPETYEDDEILEQYKDHGQEFLKRKRIILTYEEKDEDKIKKMLNVEEVRKVVYTLEELDV